MSQDDSNLADTTRRAVIKGAAGALGVSAMGAASAHEWGEKDEESGPAGKNSWKSQRTETRGETNKAEVVGYHALGKIGSPNENRRAEAQNPHYGGITEIRTHGDYAYVGFFSSGSETPGRGMAILDISDYNSIPADASSSKQQAMLETAEISVVSFLRNNTASASVMDVKVSDDGNYVFLSTQPYQPLFGPVSGNTGARTNPTVIEGLDPSPNAEDEGSTRQTAGIVAVDVSDKANPETVGNFNLEGSGSHNAYHHRINGEEYVFCINDSGNLAGAGEGMFVLRFDRSTGTLELVNQWEYEGDLAQGQTGPSDVQKGAYIHDMEIQNDPRTGTPVVYLAYWGRGMWALDASDPENLEALGHFEMNASHFASPAPTLVNGKRVAVTSQEVSANDSHTGRVYLVDCDGLFEGEDGYNPDGPTQLGELDMWEWQNEYTNPAKSNGSESDQDTATTTDGSDIDFGPYDFSLSPHNSDFARHVDRNGNESFWIHQAHYGGGIQYLRVEPGTDDGLTGDARFQSPAKDAKGNKLKGSAAPHNTTDWTLEKEGSSRPQYGTPKDSRLEGLNYITPFVWGAHESNGITFASDINQGVHAVKADGVPIGGAAPNASVSRTTDGSVFTAGQTNQVDITVDFTDEDVVVRDAVPEGWSVVAGDDYTTYERGGTTFVEFLKPASAGDTRTYFAEAPDSSGSYEFGEVEVRAASGRKWHRLAGTTAGAYVLGQSSSGLALGTAAGAVGAMAHQRDRAREKLGDLLDREE